MKSEFVDFLDRSGVFLEVSAGVSFSVPVQPREVFSTLVIHHRRAQSWGTSLTFRNFGMPPWNLHEWRKFRSRWVYLIFLWSFSKEWYSCKWSLPYRRKFKVDCYEYKQLLANNVHEKQLFENNFLDKQLLGKHLL